MARTTDAGGTGISVTMDGERVVIRPSGHLDRDAIDTVRALLSGATTAGVAAVVDLARIDDRQRADVLAALADRLDAGQRTSVATPLATSSA